MGITYSLVKYGPALPGLGLRRFAPTWRFSIMRMAPQVLGYRAALRSFVRRCRSNITSSVSRTCFMVRAKGGGYENHDPDAGYWWHRVGDRPRTSQSL